MKTSKEDRRILRREIQQGFIQAWVAASHAKKGKRRQPQKSGWSRWFAFWNRPAKAAPTITVAKAAGSDK